MFSHGIAMKVVFPTGMLLSAAAGAQGWSGFYVDGAIGARSSSTTTTMTSTYSQSFPLYGGGTQLTSSTGTSQQDLSQTNFLGEFSAGYRFSVAEKVIVGLGVFVDAAASSAGESSSSSRYSSLSPWYSYSTASSNRTTLEQTGRYGLSLDVAPNWRTHPYAKVTYAWSTYELSSSTLNCLAGSSPGAWSSSATVSGLGFGGGLRHLQTDNLYFFAEVMWQGYGSKNKDLTSLCPLTSSPYSIAVSDTSVEIDPSNVVGVVGMGWRF